ncbi:hypothetical protein Sjap_004354 [Stephania japonica]|uniref:Uncharacterized protein n=1 Tax=Stephania japonica TaxID=461633 RepID=A0AAP0K245_9MAGN
MASERSDWESEEHPLSFVVNALRVLILGLYECGERFWRLRESTVGFGFVGFTHVDLGFLGGNRFDSSFKVVSERGFSCSHKDGLFLLLLVLVCVFGSDLLQRTLKMRDLFLDGRGGWEMGRWRSNMGDVMGEAMLSQKTIKKKTQQTQEDFLSSSVEGRSGGGFGYFGGLERESW